MPWTSDARPSVEHYAAMATVCLECPVLSQCAAYALKGHNGNGVDGGFYAGVYIPWPTYYRHAQRDMSRRSARHALRRHIAEPVS